MHLQTIIVAQLELSFPQLPESVLLSGREALGSASQLSTAISHFLSNLKHLSQGEPRITLRLLNHIISFPQL